MTVFIKDHARLYIGRRPEDRTQLTPTEIAALLDSGSYVRLGEDKEVHFDLLWDYHKDVGVVLLTAPGWFENETVVITIWKADFVMRFPPSPEQLGLAREKAELYRSQEQQDA